VHPAGTGETPAMPPNLTSVPHPNAASSQSQSQSQNPYTQTPPQNWTVV
jgi:hypothetical protein